jgi:hypothetical protein
MSAHCSSSVWSIPAFYLCKVMGLKNLDHTVVQLGSGYLDSFMYNVGGPNLIEENGQRIL